MIPIVKPYLPPLEKYTQYIEGVYERNWLTNSGPLHVELESRLQEYLGVEHLMLVANGTLALQVAYRALGLESCDVVTTPFTFAATPGSLKWQNLQPIFSDIQEDTFNLDPVALDLTLQKGAKAVLPVHVFGNPCDVEGIDEVANKHNCKVIYDAAHAFGSKYKGKSVLNWGDAATLSLHATKLFHCVEGGAIIFKRRADKEHAKQLINFGFDGQNNPEFVGINAKLSEVHAAMGLAVLDDIDRIIEKRATVVYEYQKQLRNHCDLQRWNEFGQNNGAYMPILLDDESKVLSVMESLEAAQIQSRRYFYPSLSNCDCYGEPSSLDNSDDISMRVLCLPLFWDMTVEEITRVTEKVKAAL